MQRAALRLCTFSNLYFFKYSIIFVSPGLRFLTRDSAHTVELCPIFVANEDGRMLAIVEQNRIMGRVMSRIMSRTGSSHGLNHGSNKVESWVEQIGTNHGSNRVKSIFERSQS